MTRIISWANEEVEYQGNCPLTLVRRGRAGLVLEAVTGSSSMYEGAISVEIPWEFITRGTPAFTTELVAACQNRSGSVRYHIRGIRSGYWDWENSRTVRQIRVREATLEWPEGFLDALQRGGRQGPPVDRPFSGGLSGAFRPRGRRGR